MSSNPMTFIDISIAQPSLQNHLPPLRAQNPLSAKFDDPSLFFASKQLRFPRNVSLRGKNVIKAPEPHSCLHNGEVKLNSSQFDRVKLKSSQLEAPPPPIDLHEDELDEREKLRRIRISKANKGNTPWNKGRKHSAETVQLIRERTKIAMQDPKIRQKLANLGHAQSTETRVKIGEGVRLGWQRRRGQMMVQESCHIEWLNLIAEASRRGFAGQDELQWGSYKVLNEQLEQEWKQSVELRKSMPRGPKGSKRAPKSLEQRRKIAQAVAAKWADPEYRERVCNGLAKYHGNTSSGGERKPRRRPSPSRRRQGTLEENSKSEKIRIQNERLKLSRSKTPRYKDPQVSSKLEMIKNIRAQRAVEETKATEAIQRARLLIAEAEKAAKALEVAAMKSPIAQASLVETRKLIDEAIQSIESMTNQNEEHGRLEKEEKVNGSSSLASRQDEEIDLGSFSIQDILKPEHELSLGFMMGTGSKEQMEPNGNGIKFQFNGTKVKSAREKTPAKPITSTKRWLNGRLVQVAQGE